MYKYILASFFVISSLAMAQQQGRPMGPPQEAVDACSNKSETESCTFEGRRGEEVSGTCELPPSDANSSELACKPEGMDERGGPGRREEN